MRILVHSADHLMNTHNRRNILSNFE